MMRSGVATEGGPELQTRLWWDSSSMGEVENADEVFGLLQQCVQHYRDAYPVELVAGRLDMVGCHAALLHKFRAATKREFCSCGCCNMC